MVPLLEPYNIATYPQTFTCLGSRVINKLPINVDLFEFQYGGDTWMFSDCTFGLMLPANMGIYTPTVVSMCHEIKSFSE